MNSRLRIFVIAFLSLCFPLAASATSYLPGQTLNPSCAPSDPTCVVVPNTTSSYFVATSSSATSTFAGNVAVSGNVSVGSLSGILRAVAGVITSTLVNLTSDVTGILGIPNGGTGISSAPSYGQVLVGNGSGGYALTATSSLGILGGGGGTWGSITGTLSNQTDLQTALNSKLASTSLQTSALLASLVTDHTGSGSLVFGTSPTFAGTPVFGGGLVNYSVNSTTTIPNGNPYAWTVATSSSASP
ncbi:MAG TPA: hypothetical protein VMU13_00915, partial [Candidatus Paceibacterota bacterium]|nr:hypothetical protein [Candidatus Paceibacterota bacterium]